MHKHLNSITKIINDLRYTVQRIEGNQQKMMEGKDFEDRQERMEKAEAELGSQEELENQLGIPWGMDFERARKVII